MIFKKIFIVIILALVVTTPISTTQRNINPFDQTKFQAVGNRQIRLDEHRPAKYIDEVREKWKTLNGTQLRQKFQCK
jgi:hypothetical protein